MSAIFGGSKSKSSSTSTSQQESGNKSYPQINTDYGPSGAAAFNQSNNALGHELNGGFDNYKKNIGFDFLEKMGLRKSAGTASGMGIFNSGATLKGLANYDSGITQQAYGGYLDNLFKRMNAGMQAGNLVSQSGQYSTGTSNSSSQGMSSSNNGSGQFLGSVVGAVAAASDRRLKNDIVKLHTLKPGLNLYSFTYKDGSGPFVGVMADEVEKVMPEALGPVIDGYQYIDYAPIHEAFGPVSSF